jgi:hypothetical protein
MIAKFKIGDKTLCTNHQEKPIVDRTHCWFLI